MFPNYSINQPWSTFSRIALRSICFKGGDNEVDETSSQVASSEIAMKNYNDYMETINPFTEMYVEDVSSDSTNREAKVAGMVNADMAAKNGLTTIDPNKGLNPSSTAGVATVTADAQTKANQGVKSAKAAGLQSVVDIGMGKATTAQQGLSTLAAQSVAEATNSATAQQKVADANLSAAGTAGGMAIGMSKNMYDDNTKKK